MFHQNKGIPMGGNSSSGIADLSLCKCEFNYMADLVRSKKLGLAKLLSANSRYVDDLIIVNYLNFELLISTIYPSDLKMERSGNNNRDVNYLDTNVVLDGSGGASTDLYNKLDDFNFPVVMYTFPHGNMPVNIGYNVFTSQVIRYSNIISHIHPFIIATNNLYRILLARGYSEIALKKKFRQLLRNRNEILLKYKVEDLKDIEDQVFSVL